MLKRKILLAAFLLSSNFLCVNKTTSVNAAQAIDFEFNSIDSIANFQAVNGTVSKTNNNELKANVTSSLFSLQTPDINVSKGNKYSALLSVRNTILLRLKNNTDASKITLYYITSNNKEYSEDMKKEFDIKPNSDYESYFFNISDTKNCNGYLRGLKFVFNNSNTGDILIDAITFEREDALVNYLGEITSCLANKDNKTVTIKGKIKDGYVGKDIKVMQSDSKNYDESLNYQDGVILTTTKVKENNEFEATFSLMKDKNTTHLSSMFILSIDNVKVNKSCMIENYKDFSEVTNRFTIPSKEVVKVTDERFAAKGDSFTDDTKAIQKAIDYVSEAGGGKVILPGDDSIYGKRYMATQINMKSNVEFVIETGAILWQSPRYEQYHYKDTTPIYGHESNIDNMMWCHACATVNYPLLYVANCENVRITGGGTIRMMDNGIEETESAKFLGDPGMNVACNSIIHICPTYFYLSKNIDVVDINIKRANGWHMANQNCENVYYANVIESEIGCITSDGFSFSCVKDGYVERCMTYTSDDALVFSTKYNDDRGKWFHQNIEGDNSTQNIKVRSSYLWGGFGVSFIPWGTGDSNLSNHIISDIDIQDCVLGGQKSVGVWADDPFYGYSKRNTYNNTEADYTPIRDVYFNNNVYLNGFEMYLLINRVPVTNLLVLDNDDYSTKSPSQFVLGGFDRNLRFGPNYADESNFVSGLAYWSYKGDTGTIKIDDNYNSSGFINNDGELYQGLYERAGFYRLSIKTMLNEGNGYLFVRDALTKEILFKKQINKSEQFVENIVEFNIYEDKTLQIGIEHTGSGTIYLDDASIKMLDDCHLLDSFFKETFENNTLLNIDTLNNEIVNKDNNKMLNLTDNISLNGMYNDFDMLTDFINENNATLTFVLTNEREKVESFNVDLSKYSDNKKHLLGLTFKDNEVTICVDYEKIATNTLALDGTKYINLKTNKAILLDNINVNKADSLNIIKEKRNIDLVINDDITINYLNKNDVLYDGDVVTFTLSRDDVEVKLNGITLTKNEKNEYSFVVSENNKLEISLKEIIVPDNPKKGCRGNTAVSSTIIALLVVLTLKRKSEEM